MVVSLTASGINSSPEMQLIPVEGFLLGSKWMNPVSVWTFEIERHSSDWILRWEDKPLTGHAVR